jgi:hypothetical protein
LCCELVWCFGRLPAPLFFIVHSINIWRLLCLIASI